MNSILKKLNKTREQLVSTAEKRDEKYLKASEKWQDSPKGVAYEVNTSLIADVVNDIDSAIENVKLFLKD